MEVCITGSFGSGKSTVLDYLNSLGYACLSADDIVTELLVNNQEIKSKFKKRFGLEVFNPKGFIDKKKISKIVFNKSDELKWIENILHPLVNKEWLKFKKNNSSGVVFYELPLLFEKKLEKNFNIIVCITCSTSVAEKRLKSRGFSKSDIALRKRQQLSDQFKLDRSDFNILNDGSIESLYEQTNKLLSILNK